MNKITEKEFEELIVKDEALTAKAKEITGEGDELKGKIKDFASSLGYELDFNAEPEENKVQDISLDELENISGGIKKGIQTTCKHNWVFIRCEPGRIWGYNKVYRCSCKCGKELIVWD